MKAELRREVATRMGKLSVREKRRAAEDLLGAVKSLEEYASARVVLVHGNPLEHLGLVGNAEPENGFAEARQESVVVALAPAEPVAREVKGPPRD